MAGFLKAVDQFHQELSELTTEQKRRGYERSPVTWSYVASKIVQVLGRYPTGLTDAVILSELVTGLNDQNMLTTKSLSEKELGCTLTVSEILESRQANISACIECYIRPVSEGNDIKTTRIVRLIDRKLVDQGYVEEACLPAVEMYLHQKICCMEEKFVNYPLRMTNLRVHNLQSKQLGSLWDFRLLPTEYVIPVLNPVSDKSFISERFLSLDGIWDEDTFPHYSRNLLVTINEIGRQETIHNPYGDSTRKVDISVMDSKSNKIKLMLWDEAVAFRNIFSVGDLLCIEEPFLVRDGNDAHLEYGPATIFYLIPANISTEIISSQATQNDSSLVKRSSDGRLDFQSYPNRFVSVDLKRNSLHVTFVGIIKTLSPKVVFEHQTVKGYKFDIEIFDEFGALKVAIFDDSCQHHKTLSPGQVLLLENLQTDDFNCCLLKTFEGGKLSNISSLKGYVASPCMYELVEVIKPQDHGFVMLGKISELKTATGRYVRQAHFTCLASLCENGGKGLWCPRCQCTASERVDLCGKLETEDISKKWIWQYNVTIFVEKSSPHQLLTLQVSECACEELFHMSSEEFASKEEQFQKSIIDEMLGKTCIITVSKNDEHVLQADSVEIATESFLENFNK